MAMYRCSRCENTIDNDWHPCTEDPRDELGLMCPDCAEEASGEIRSSGAFSADQLAFIRKMEAEDEG